QDHVLADAGLGDDEIVDVEVVVVLGVGDGAFQHLLDLMRDAARRELQLGERSLDALAADGLRHQVQLARAGADVAADGRGLGVREDAGARFLAHQSALFAFLSPPPAEWPWKVRVGENSPSLWPTMSSVTSTGMCFLPL